MWSASVASSWTEKRRRSCGTAESNSIRTSCIRICSRAGWEKDSIRRGRSRRLNSLRLHGQAQFVVSLTLDGGSHGKEEKSQEGSKEKEKEESSKKES